MFVYSSVEEIKVEEVAYLFEKMESPSKASKDNGKDGKNSEFMFFQL